MGTKLSRYDKVDLAYEFLLQKEISGNAFSIEELAKNTGWKFESCRTYISKRWFQFLTKIDNGKYVTQGIQSIGKENFRHIHSQTLIGTKINSEQAHLIRKAKEFALLAVSTYNNPFTELKTYGFIVNIVIAYTSLFHAIFNKRSIDYFYKDPKTGSYTQIDGDKKAWELKTCCKEYWGNQQTPEKINLDFLIGLRNKIEHKNLPHLDLIVAGYCQAALGNFESILINEFGESHALIANLAIAMQLTKVATDQQIHAMKAFQKENYQAIKDYMETFNDDLSMDVLDSQKYRIRVLLVPKIGNHKNSSDLAIEFLDAKNLSGDELQNYNRGIALIKGVELPYKLKPKRVVEKVKEHIPHFNMASHTRAWKQYKARPSKINQNYKGKHAGYVEGFDGYLYTEEWVKFLIEKYS